MPQIIPIKDLKNTSEISDLCHSTSEPVFITKNDILSFKKEPVRWCFSLTGSYFIIFQSLNLHNQSLIAFKSYLCI